ncbi:hypothetical protein Dimus_007867, partial [Dionaea muscipula]
PWLGRTCMVDRRPPWLHDVCLLKTHYVACMPPLPHDLHAKTTTPLVCKNFMAARIRGHENSASRRHAQPAESSRS